MHATTLELAAVRSVSKSPRARALAALWPKNRSTGFFFLLLSPFLIPSLSIKIRGANSGLEVEALSLGKRNLQMVGLTLHVSTGPAHNH